jgi:hypothetical protein
MIRTIYNNKMAAWLNSGAMTTVLLAGAIVVALLVTFLGSATAVMLILATITAPLLLWVAITRMEWLIASFLLFSPLHYILRYWLPAPLDALWRDLLFALILIGWLLRLLLQQHTIIWNRYSFYVLVLIGWVALQAINSPTWLTGILGFRTILRYFPLFFIVMDTFRGPQRERRMALYIGAFLTGATLNAVFAAAQFLFISILQTSSAGATWIDPIRMLGVGDKTVYPWSRLDINRALGFFPDPNYLGQTLTAAFCFLFARWLWPVERQKRLWSSPLVLLYLFAMVGTIAIFAIGPGLLAFTILILARLTRRYRRILLSGIFIVFLTIGLLMLLNVGGLTWVGYQSENVLRQVRYIPLAIAERNLFGAGLATSADLANRFSIATGPATAEGPLVATVAWFFFDETVWQIGLLGTLYWIVIWLLFANRGFRITLFLKPATPEHQLMMGSWVALISLLAASLHYGSVHISGVDILLPTMWAYIAAASVTNSWQQPEEKA